MSIERILVGLTGNIATGKSTATNIFKELGAVVIDADKVVHELYKKNCLLRLSLVWNFGLWVIDYSSLSIDRKKLAKIVFSDKTKLEKLNSIVWPYVKREIEKRVKKEKGVVIIEAAMLYESGWDRHMDYTIFVKADRKKQLERLLQRNFSKDEAEKRINAQAPQEKKAAKADYVIDNSRSIEYLKHQVYNVWEDLKKRLDT